jgi:hypothetical protein
MANNVAAAGGQDDAAQPMFDVQKVQLRFDISADFVAAQVANNVLVLALSTGRILRFDLDNDGDIDDIDLPKRPQEIGVIRKLFLDPTASHLLISTTAGENFYLHSQSRQAKQLGKLKGVQVEAVGWNPSLPTASTREILLGASDGSVIETFIEPNSEFLRNHEKYARVVYNTQDGAVVGIYADLLSTVPETRRVLVATQNRLLHFAGRSNAGGRRNEGSGAYAKLFESEAPSVHENPRPAGTNPPCLLAVSPDMPEASQIQSADPSHADRTYAWLCAQGVFHGKLQTSVPDPTSLGAQVFAASKLFASTKLPPTQSSSGRSRATQPPISSIALTQFHALALVEGRITAFNRLDSSIVYNQQILEQGQANLGLFVDHQKQTYWLFTPQEIFEIVVTDEARDVWKIMLKQGLYEVAQQYAKTTEQKDTVASVTGDHLISRGRFKEAAVVLGRSTKAFEDVALSFIDHGEQDALRQYLTVKLSTLKKDSTMQRVLLASWLVELYMAKLNQLDDTLSTKAELAANGGSAPVVAVDTSEQLPLVRNEFQNFVSKYKSDLDRRTTYEIISAHGREEELLFFANVVDDYDYVLSYWVQRERWTEAMTVLKRQIEPQLFYRYSTVLMAHMPAEMVDILMRQSDLDTKKIIPALLNYNKIHAESVSLRENQAIRYLQYCINHIHSTEPAVHNTLISMYAAHPGNEESALLTYLETQETAREQNYDADFALRLCISHNRVQSAVHVYRTMEQYASAVDLALKHDHIDLAAGVADQPGNDPALRKKLWLKVAKKVISQNKGIKAAIEFLKKCELLRIEDLIPFFPDFVIIDDFKEEICAALEEYSRQISSLKTEMDDSAATAKHIQEDIAALEHRYAIVEPGERCWKCRFPLLQRQFFVFPCQHAFHADCLGDSVMRVGGAAKAKRIRELQREIGRGVAGEKRREEMARELDGLVAGACVLCSEMAVRMIDEPFIAEGEQGEEWAV